MITVVHDGVEVHFDDTNLNPERPGLIHGALLQNHFYEEGFLKYIRSLNRKGTYVDIGAFVGTHTLYFALLCGADRVHSFEPRAAVFQALKRNVELNDVGDQVVLHELALTDEPGTFTLTMGDSSYVVPGARLDDLVDEDVAVIKIDVEGMEPAVLRGAERVLRRSRPVVFAEAATEPEYRLLVETLRKQRYVATGRRFNATPTYEFVPMPTRARQMFDSPLVARARLLVPLSVRRRLRRFAPHRD